SCTSPDRCPRRCGDGNEAAEPHERSRQRGPPVMAQYEMNLRDYWLIVRRRRLIIVVSTVLVTLLSFWFSKQRVPIYESTSSVRYEQTTSLSGLMLEVLTVG